jgi:perosamine synthetase
MGLRYYAPAGSPLAPFAVGADLLSGMFGARAARELAVALGGPEHPHVWLISSGRAAMSTVLGAMRDVNRDAARDEVVIPAYTCYSVPASIERAGLVPRLCDIDPATLSPHRAALARVDFSRVLAVCSANLYGLPNDLPELEVLARRQGVFMLDDAAQALGARCGERAVGTFGDVGIYSFDKGKNITTIQGGAIVCRDGPLAAAIEKRVAALPAAGAVEAGVLAAKLLLYAAALRPWAYGLIRRLPGLKLGLTPYELECPCTRLSPMLAAAALPQWRRLPALAAHRTRAAAAYRAALKGLPGIHEIEPLPGAVPAWARFPTRMDAPIDRGRAIATLEAAGIGATASYPMALCDVPEVAARMRATTESFVGARAVAAHIVTLPTHPYCPPHMAADVREHLEISCRV